MTSKIDYSIKLTEAQLINYLHRYKINNPKDFDSDTNLVEITIAIFAKRHFEKTSGKNLLVAFELKEKLFITYPELNDPIVASNVLAKRNYDSLIDFMLVPIDKSNIAYAFQVKRFFIKTTDKKIEASLARVINNQLKLKLSQEIYLIIAPDKYLKSVIWSTKIDLSRLRKLIKKRSNSYQQIFIMVDNGLIKV